MSDAIRCILRQGQELLLSSSTKLPTSAGLRYQLHCHLCLLEVVHRLEESLSMVLPRQLWTTRWLGAQLSRRLEVWLLTRTTIVYARNELAGRSVSEYKLKGPYTGSKGERKAYCGRLSLLPRSLIRPPATLRTVSVRSSWNDAVWVVLKPESKEIPDCNCLLCQSVAMLKGGKTDASGASRTCIYRRRGRAELSELLVMRWICSLP
jgi:hypothetical protein